MPELPSNRPGSEPRPASDRRPETPSIVATSLTARPVAARSLQDRRCLVIGGSRGIGAAVVRRFAREGAAVALTWASRQELAAATVAAAREHGGPVLSLHADSLRSETIGAAVESTVDAFGGLDVLVYSAAVGVFGALHEMPTADLDRALHVNVRSAYLACQAAARRMGNGGRLIVIGSQNSDHAALPGNSVYAMTKAALTGMVKGMARDLAPLGITVNNVQPGPTDTDMNPASSEFADMVRRQFIAVGRYGSPDEIAGLIAWIAGPESSYMTGSNVLIDGGFTA
jgi:3-oxoacyl-[acyl-carrier protein] reductase